MDSLNLNSLRSRKARLAAKIGPFGFKVSVAAVWLFAILALLLFVMNGPKSHGAYGLLGLTLLFFMLSIWYEMDLQKLPPAKNQKSLDEILEPRLLASFKVGAKITPPTVWQAATRQWQARFLCNHLLLDAGIMEQLFTDGEELMPEIWHTALNRMEQSQAATLDSGALATALLVSSQAAVNFLAKQELKPDDVTDVYAWLQRLQSFLQQPKPYFGGFGRDWATGYTPSLDQLGQNISRQVESGGQHFHTLAHADVLDSVVHNLNSGSVALVGDAGVGKSALVYALAERLLEGRDPSLRYFQIVSLDASSILSRAKDELEQMMLELFAEAVSARNIIIFLDNANLFFAEGTGAFDMSKILLPLLQNQRIKLIAAFTPDDFQQLKNNNSEMAAHLPNIVIKEPDAATTIKILEDNALRLEAANKIIISYQAVKEAFHLSGQYMQDLAYPGKAISLLEQSLPYAKDGLLSAQSVQQAVEKTRGVKVARAEAPEADVLLHLEEKIHSRMVNQERAVKVVSAALRRGRAGVSDPNRPIGSFLFLGPTGVGKTELARSLAAIYFGDEHNMVRLDMSEYQSAEDTAKLLDPGGNSNKSLILKIREQPFCVVLLDEVEKAHPNILNLLLQLLDEGQLTDDRGHATSFKNAIIIATSNAGAVEISQKVAAGDALESFERPLIEKLIGSGQFKPELINRFDEVVLFRPLNKSELAQVASFMLNDVNKTLSNQNISVKLTDAALQKVVEAGYDPEFGARPMRRALQKLVEDAVAKKVLSKEAQPGSTITLDVNDLSV